MSEGMIKLKIENRGTSNCNYKKNNDNPGSIEPGKSAEFNDWETSDTMEIWYEDKHSSLAFYSEDAFKNVTGGKFEVGCDAGAKKCNFKVNWESILPGDPKVNVTVGDERPTF